MLKCSAKVVLPEQTSEIQWQVAKPSHAHEFHHASTRNSQRLAEKI